MEAQILDMDSEVLAEFRGMMNAAIRSVIGNLMDKELSAGEVSAKLAIELDRKTTEDGEVLWFPRIKPDVKLKIGAKGRMEGSAMEGMFLRRKADGTLIVSGQQITMDDLMAAGRKGA